jgi:hypothetical protein
LIQAFDSVELVIVTEHRTDRFVCTGVGFATPAMPTGEVHVALTSGAWQLMLAVVTVALEPPQFPETNVAAVPCVESWTDAVTP